MQSEITYERKEAYTEISKILSCMDEKYVNKIPNNLKDFFKNNSLPDYNFNININKPLTEQNLSRKTLTILAMLNLNYWCEDEKHKQNLLDQYNENEKIYLDELNEKYNPDNIFKDKEIKIETPEESVTIVEHKETFFTKIKNWFNRTFKKIKM